MTDVKVVKKEDLKDAAEMLKLYLLLPVMARHQAMGVVIGLNMQQRPPEPPKKTA